MLALDGAEDADDLGAVKRIAGSCDLLITSRKRADAPAVLQRQDMIPLAQAEALKLLRAWGGGADM